MKLRNLFKLALLASVVTFIAPSCTKEGPAGAAGVDGTDGTASCIGCHGGTVMAQKEAEFSMSAHSVGAIAVDYAGGRASCAPCHSHEQFVAFANFGLPIAGDITNPSAWKCNTCHGLHKTFADSLDYALRVNGPVVPVVALNGPMDLKGNSNLCGTCHQARTAEPNKATPGTTFALTVRTGPHHGPQGNLVFGNGLAEIVGTVVYPAAGSSAHLTQASCTGCHMAPFTAKQGGHSFIPSVAQCNACHEGTDITDFNYGNVQTDTHAKLVQLRDRLVELGAMTKTTVDGVDTYAPADKKVVPMVQAQAVYNYFGIEEDRSLGVHNPKYVKAILANSIAALN
jgi:hypothetical protein